MATEGLCTPQPLSSQDAGGDIGIPEGLGLLVDFAREGLAAGGVESLEIHQNG